jgi:L-Lysine epsilon oxidase N-terminal/L-lysine epsilon oxidase C-terminal domain
MDLAAIQTIAIHPAIGIARVGNSPDKYFIGAEIPGSPPIDDSEFRDAAQKIKRQVARFRLFGLDAKGKVVGEITAADADAITWSVHIANTKAEWFRFDEALDIPATKGTAPGATALASNRRNASITGNDRARLRIDPGARTISGRNTNADGSDPRYAFDTGRIFDTQVYLGELRTDDAGRLLCFGGRGHSGSWDKRPLTPGEFANNDGWYDDVADGTVDAEVRIGGRSIEVTGAWVVVAPPDYAPGIQAAVTGYDLLLQAAIDKWPKCAPKRPVFSRHIYPLLSRLSAYQWANRGFYETFGWGSPLDFSDHALARRLASRSAASRPLREAVFHRFRNPKASLVEADAWPAVYGDAMALNPTGREPMQYMSVLRMQHAWLAQWANGDFIGSLPTGPKAWIAMSPAEQALGLDEAALENTIGGPFHPGAEFTWPMRMPILYSAPFRIKRRGGPEPDWGDQITSSMAARQGGILDGANPGDITRWMALPWQADTSSCLSGYNISFGQYLPTFWPARVPNDVLTEEDYQAVMNSALPEDQRVAAFGPDHRMKWLRGIVYMSTDPTKRTDGRQAFIDDGWWQVGIVTHRPGPAGSPLFPRDLWVETHRIRVP